MKYIQHTRESLIVEQPSQFHFENALVAVLEWNSDLIVTKWYSGAEHIFGLKKEETIGKRIGDLNIIHVDDLPIVKRLMKRLAKGKDLTVIFSCRNYTRSNNVLECTWYNSVLLDRHGHAMSVLSLVQDLSRNQVFSNYGEMTLRP